MKFLIKNSVYLLLLIVNIILKCIIRIDILVRIEKKYKCNAVKHYFIANSTFSIAISILLTIADSKVVIKGHFKI